jgi:hypothetical protein
MTSSGDLSQRALEQIARCNDPEQLRRFADNAKKLGNGQVQEAALRKLYASRPSAQPGTLEYDVWQSIYALEDALTDERGRTTLLGRTRQKIARDGELIAVADLVRKPASDGYKMLIERGWPELTFEAVALKHPDRFSPEVLEAARKRLAASSIARDRDGDFDGLACEPPC